jgi:hypothetical protein
MIRPVAIWNVTQIDALEKSQVNERAEIPKERITVEDCEWPKRQTLWPSTAEDRNGGTYIEFW